MGRSRRKLGFWYRVGWRINYTLLSIMGPPELSGSNDPRRRMRAERAERERRLARSDPD